MAASSTTRVEIDTDLLDRCASAVPSGATASCSKAPPASSWDAEAMARVRKRFAGVPMEEIEREAVKAVREARREHATKRRVAG